MKVCTDGYDWEVQEELSDGRILVLSAWRELEESDVWAISLYAADPCRYCRIDRKWGIPCLILDCDVCNPCDDDGLPVGPGGLEVWGLLPDMLDELESQVPQGNILQVGAVSEKLYRIYKVFLARRGYTRVAGHLVKMLG